MSWFNKLLGGSSEMAKPKRIFRFDKVRQIGIILDDPENETLLNARNFLKHFKGVQSTYLIYVSGEKKVDNFLTALEFNEKSFDWRKKPKKKEEISVFLEQKYDILIDYSEGTNSLIDWVLEHTEARLKIGKLEKDVYQFSVITEEGNFQGFNEEILKYLSLINNFEWDEEEWEALEAQE